MIHSSVFYSKQIFKKSFIFLFKGAGLIHVEVNSMLFSNTERFGDPRLKLNKNI